MHVLYSAFLIAGSMVLSLNSFACDQIPRDPQGSTEEIEREGRMRVGVVDAPPLVWTDDGEVYGPEAELMRKFAETLGAEVEWAPMSHEEAMSKNERFELHAVVAGTTRSTPWGTKVGLSRPYMSRENEAGETQHHVIVVGPGENELLMRLDRFIYAHAEEVQQQWQAMTRPATTTPTSTRTGSPPSR